MWPQQAIKSGQKFGIKSTGFGIKIFWYCKNVLHSVLFRFWVLSVTIRHTLVYTLHRIDT